MPVARRPRTRSAWVALLALVGLVPLLTAGCGAERLDGRVGVVGSTTLLPMISALAGAFAAEHPLVAVEARMKGTSDGLGSFCDGIDMISGASRPLSERERSACRASGVRFVRLHVADDAVVLFTGLDSAVRCLTGDQIYALMGPQSTAVESWADASAVIAGAGADLPETALAVVGPGTASGTRRVLTDLVIKPIAAERGVPAALRSDYRALASEQLIADTVASTPGGLGFSGLATAAASSRIRLLEVDLGGGCSAASPATVRDGSYPLGRPLFLYVNLDAARGDPTLRAFVESALSDDGLRLATASGGLAIDPDEAAQVREHWRRALDGNRGDDA